MYQKGIQNRKSKEQEEFEDPKGVIRIRISKKNIHNDQKKKDKRTNNDLQNTYTEN